MEKFIAVRAGLGVVALVGSIVMAGPANAGSLTDAIELALTAQIEGDVYQKEGKPDERLVARLDLDTLWAPVAWGEVAGKFALSIDSDHEIDRTLDPDFRETAIQPRSLEVTELTGAAHFSSVDITAGKLVANWGIGDLFQPTDAVTPRDLTDPLRDRRLGSSGILADWYPGNLDLSVAVVRHAPHRLPQSGYRWFPIGVPGEIDFESDLPSGSDAAIFATRLRGSLRGLDWALTARRGPDLAPHIALNGQLPRLVYPDMTLVGGSVSAARGELVLRTEIAYRRYDRIHGNAVDEDFATLLAGVERRFPALVFGTDATVIVELVRDEHVSGPELPREIAILDPVRLLRTGLSARILTHNPTGWEAEAGIVNDLSEGGGFVQLLIRRNLGDRVDIELGIDLLSANGNAAFEPVADNDRATIRVVSHL